MYKLVALATLLLLQAGTTRLPFDSQRRTQWHYVPGDRPGVAIGAMNASQRSTLDDLMRRSLSEQGRAKAKGVIELESILGRDPDRYWLAMFGDRSAPLWGWKFEGHHLSLNATVTKDEFAITPAFFGANPATVPSGPRRGWRLLKDEEDLGRQLLRGLSKAQRAEAVISSRAPGDIVTGNDRQTRLEKYEGLTASRMNATQRDLLMRLIDTYVGNASAPVSDREMAKLKAAGMDHLYFAWAGDSEPGQPHYYRIHGPTILIEYDNTQGGANHIHSVWRTPGRDFGEDLLRKHYAEAAHHRKRADASE